MCGGHSGGTRPLAYTVTPTVHSAGLVPPSYLSCSSLASGIFMCRCPSEMLRAPRHRCHLFFLRSFCGSHGTLGQAGLLTGRGSLQQDRGCCAKGGSTVIQGWHPPPHYLLAKWSWILGLEILIFIWPYSASLQKSQISWPNVAARSSLTKLLLGSIYYEQSIDLRCVQRVTDKMLVFSICLLDLLGPQGANTLHRSALVIRKYQPYNCTTSPW